MMKRNEGSSKLDRRSNRTLHRVKKLNPPIPFSAGRSQPSSRPQQSPLTLGIAALGVLALGLAGAGCGGSGAHNVFVTGITVSPGASVASGTTVSLTATVQDSTLLKSATWSADGGLLSVTTGLTTQWVAPSVNGPSDFTITLFVKEMSGLTDLETVRIHVNPTGSGSVISGVTVSPSGRVAPGQEVVLTATALDSSSLRSILWSSQGGTLVTNTGLVARWISPSVASASSFPITLTVTTTTGVTDQVTVNILVDPTLLPGGSTTSTLTTGVTTAGTTTGLTTAGTTTGLTTAGTTTSLTTATTATTLGTTTVGTTTAGTTTLGTTTAGSTTLGTTTVGTTTVGTTTLGTTTLGTTTAATATTGTTTSLTAARRFNGGRSTSIGGRLR